MLRALCVVGRGVPALPCGFAAVAAAPPSRLWRLPSSAPIAAAVGPFAFASCRSFGSGVRGSRFAVGAPTPPALSCAAAVTDEAPRARAECAADVSDVSDFDDSGAFSDAAPAFESGGWGVASALASPVPRRGAKAATAKALKAAAAAKAAKAAASEARLRDWRLRAANEQPPRRERVGRLAWVRAQEAIAKSAFGSLSAAERREANERYRASSHGRRARAASAELHKAETVARRKGMRRLERCRALTKGLPLALPPEAVDYARYL